MNMKQLIELLGENSQAVDFAKSLEQDTTNNVERINDLERKLSDVTSTRDNFKKGNSVVKELLGLEQVNEESLKEFLENNKKGKADDKLSAELDNLKGLLKNAELDKNSVVTDYESKIQKMALDNEISNSGIGASFANENMYKLGLSLVKDGAVYEDGKIVYKNEDGTTAYNGANPIGIKDKIESLKSDTNYAGLFKPAVIGNGGGTPPPNQTTQSKAANQTPEQLMAEGRQ